MISSRLPFGAILLALSIPAAQAGTAYSLGAASGYNVFVLGAYSTPGGTDIQGSVAAGGNFTSTGSLSINEMAGSAAPGTAGIVVGGNLSLDGGQLDNGNAGNAWVKGTVSSSSYFTFQHDLDAGAVTPGNINVNGSTNHVSSIPIDFGAAATSLDQLSTSLAGIAANGTITVSGSSINLTATGCTLCVFDIPGGTSSGATFNIDAPAGATVLINVSGASDSMTSSSIKYTGGATASYTLFNFDTATSITTSNMTVYGSILAPLATFTGTNGSVDGELIAAAVTGETAEFESGNIFKGNLGSSLATPEPSTWGLMALALVTGIVVRMKRAA